jgi:hypothetical protein
MRLLRVLASRVTPALTGASAVALFAGTRCAAAATRLRSGGLHDRLASHVTTGQTGVRSDLALTGANITAAVVGALALLSLAFVVVTLIRRRITT